MNKKLLFLSLILITPHMHAMLTKRDKRQSTIVHKKHPNGARKYACVQKFISRHHKRPKFHSIIPQLPLEIKNKIFGYITNNSCEESLENATKVIQSFILTCKPIYKFFNDQHNCLQLIKDLSEIFHCSNETVALALKMPIAKLIFYRQFTLLQECHTNCRQDIFDLLKKDSADLNFTHGECGYGYTALTSFLERPLPHRDCTKWLLENGASIYLNGFHVFQYACTHPGSKQSAIPYFLKHPDYDGNKQDENGNTPLTYFAEFLVKWVEWMTLEQQLKIDAYRAIQQILEAGTDPEIKNNNGMTALAYVQQKAESYPEFVTLIEDAIVKKNEQKKHLTIK